MIELLNNPAIASIVTGIPAFILGYLAYRRGAKVDKASEQSVLASANTTAVTQLINGLNQLIDTLQEDNRELRQIAKECGTKLEQVVSERDAAIAELRLRLKFPNPPNQISE